MPYTVKYTEEGNILKQDIEVGDSTVDTRLGVTFVGKNYSGYAAYVAENFLHLLENFAGPNQPDNPVEGQLWYDTNPGVNQLKVADATGVFVPAGGIKKGAVQPSTPQQGDLWVNTDTQQLNLFTGSTWIVVGPQFSSGLRTGPESEVIRDINNDPHNVISFFSSDERVAIISKDAFIPKITYSGFDVINQGINISSRDFNSNNAPNKLWGTAEKSNALVVGTSTVAAANFLRSDTTSNSNFGINIRNDAGIAVGPDLATSLTNSSGAAILYHKTSGSNIDIRVNNAGVATTVIRVDSSTNVGINKTNPEESLDVNGKIKTNDSVVITGTSDATDLVTGSLKTAGGVSITKSLRVGTGANIAGTLTTNSVLPVSDSLYDLGSNPANGGVAWRKVYADEIIGTTFTGSFVGALTGNISGSASKLASATTFQITGDVASNAISFDGQSGSGFATFNSVISPDFIDTKTEITNSEITDVLLVYRPSVGGLRKTTKSTFVSNIPTVPVGAVFPFAGVTVPAGYLLCDGSEQRTSVYPELFSVLGYTYKDVSLLQGTGTFALPDLRGRFALGRDNMDNGNFVTTPLGASIDAGGGPADRVTDVTADTVGLSSGTEEKILSASNLPDHTHDMKGSAGSQYYAMRNVAFSGGFPIPDADAVPHTGLGPSVDDTGQYLPNSGGVDTLGGTITLSTPVNVMNPYLTINYIIFTGSI
jgi:microcystin-dependent protein